MGQKSPLLSASLLTYIEFLPSLRVWSRDWSYLELLVSSTSESPFLFLKEGELLPSSDFPSSPILAQGITPLYHIKNIILVYQE